MTAVVRYSWMFRTAAIICLVLGSGAVWRFGFTDYDPALRPWGAGCGLLAVVLAVFLFRGARLAVGLSAIIAACIAVSAALGASLMRAPVILMFAAVAVLFGLYAALAGRALLAPRE